MLAKKDLELNSKEKQFREQINAAYKKEDQYKMQIDDLCKMENKLKQQWLAKKIKNYILKCNKHRDYLKTQVEEGFEREHTLKIQVTAANERENQLKLLFEKEEKVNKKLSIELRDKSEQIIQRQLNLHVDQACERDRQSRIQADHLLEKKKQLEAELKVAYEQVHMFKTRADEATYLQFNMRVNNMREIEEDLKKAIEESDERESTIYRCR